MRNSPSETAAPARDIALEPRVVELVNEPDSPPRVPFSPAEGPRPIARGIFETEFEIARTPVAAH